MVAFGSDDVRWVNGVVLEIAVGPISGIDIEVQPLVGIVGDDISLVHPRAVV